MDLSREQPNGMNSTEEKKVIIRSWEGGRVGKLIWGQEYFRREENQVRCSNRGLCCFKGLGARKGATGREKHEQK